VTFLAHISRITEAESIEELWSLHVARMNEYGFDRLIYGYTRFRTAHSFGSIDDVLILSNHSRAYLDRFIKGGLYHHGPMVRWMAENDGSCSWRIISEMEASGALTEEERRVLAFNRKMGVVAGYTISFRNGSSREKGAIGLTAKPGLTQDQVDEIWDEYGQEIESINAITHLKIMSLPRVMLHRNLTPRQREVLEWVGAGKTIQDIATIMGLTVATVEKHLRLAREALDVQTTAQAVLKAAYQNQIFVFGG
jgi:LuxR family transcriptional regulator